MTNNSYFWYLISINSNIGYSTYSAIILINFTVVNNRFLAEGVGNTYYMF